MHTSYAGVQMVRDDRKKFTAADIDADGSLSSSEYRSFYQPVDGTAHA